MEEPQQHEVRSFTRSWDDMQESKKLQ